MTVFPKIEDLPEPSVNERWKTLDLTQDICSGLTWHHQYLLADRTSTDHVFRLSVDVIFFEV